MANSKNNQRLVNNRVRAAIRSTAALMPSYYGNRLLARRMEGGYGPVFKGMDIDMLARHLIKANWEPAEPPTETALPGCAYFKTCDIPSGRYGLARIADLPDSIELVAYTNDGGETIWLSALGAKGPETSETWIVIRSGKEEGIQGEIVEDLHPGQPALHQRRLNAGAIQNGEHLSKKRALQLGFDLASVQP